MSEMDQGEVELNFTLRNGDRKYLTLKPTMQAARLISNNFQGFSQARQAIVREDINACMFIMRVGAKLNEKQLKEVEEWFFQHGMGDGKLLGDILDYLIMLSNGGKPKSLVDIDNDEEINLGNASL